jgi:hypothetical protein
MTTAGAELKVGRLVRATCNSGCCCTEMNGCGVSGWVGTLVNINEHNDDGDFYGVSFPEQAHLVYFWAHELEVLTQITVSNVQRVQPAVCHRMGCSPNQATRRCTLEIVSESVLSLPFVWNGLIFSNRWVTLDLCATCYDLLNRDEMLRYLSTALIDEMEVGDGN